MGRIEARFLGFFCDKESKGSNVVDVAYTAPVVEGRMRDGVSVEGRGRCVVANQKSLSDRHQKKKAFGLDVQPKASGEVH